jgi:hypothetical protein
VASKVKTSTAPGGFDRGDVDLFHPHHRIEPALGDGWIGIGYRSGSAPSAGTSC